MRFIALAIAVGIVLLTIIFNAGTNNGFIVWERRYEPPSNEFKQKCELRKAFRIYRDHEGVWSCKLEDGRVMTEENFRKFLNN